MNKRIFGIKVGTILEVVISFITAVVVWAAVKYTQL